MHPTNPSQTLDLILNLLPLLLLNTLTIKSFLTRFQTLRSKLTHLNTSLSQISSTPHFSSNPLLLELLPNLLSTLQNIQTLSNLCNNPSFNGGKLLTQSNLDIASSSLSLHLHDLDLLLKSGVLHQSNAIVLSQPGPNSSKEDLSFFIKDLFARIQIGGIEFKKKALDSLLVLLKEDDKNSVLVAESSDNNNNIGYLIHLLDANNHSLIRELAVFAISILSIASDFSRKAVFEEGGLGPLLRILESGSSVVKEKAGAAIEAITEDPENAWAVSAYGGVNALIEALRSGSPATRKHASGALKNVAGVEEIRSTMVEEGAVSVLIDVLGTGGPAEGNAAHCLWILASAGEDFRVLIVKEGGLQRLLQLIQEPPNPETLEHVLRTIYALSDSLLTARALSSSLGFLSQLAELIRQGNSIIQQISVSLLCNLSLNETSKRAISGCMGSLIKMLEFSKPIELQDHVARVLVSLLLVRGNRRDFSRDEKSLSRLVHMLDPKNEGVCKKFPILLVSALAAGSGHGCRKRLVAAGVCQHLQMLADMEVAGAKKALQKLAGNRLKNIFGRTWRE
ncbi:ARM repeat superfamily protein [Tasmannia lanceolata]|uniref:ARM repeat superfamily protein n=1 Tax=Tasmannia lanceolata TaxID=3420 RepID=UPI004063415C